MPRKVRKAVFPAAGLGTRFLPATKASGAIGEIQITDAMRSLLQKRPFYAVRFEGKRHDAGDKLGFLMATVEFALKHEDLAPEFRQYLSSLKVD
jgi:UTP--glucose-1-phosphate uridylyltransferase